MVFQLPWQFTASLFYLHFSSHYCFFAKSDASSSCSGNTFHLSEIKMYLEVASFFGKTNLILRKHLFLSSTTPLILRNWKVVKTYEFCSTLKTAASRRARLETKQQRSGNSHLPSAPPMQQHQNGDHCILWQGVFARIFSR